MGIKYVLYFITFLILPKLYSQKLQGTIKDNFNSILPRANIVIKETIESTTILEYFISDDQGNFSYILDKNYNDSIFIEVTVLNYKKSIHKIVNPDIDKVYTIDFIMNPKATELEEVIISERKKFNVKKDTVVFNVEKYKDGTERKVEDVLSKLPGVEVQEDGSIKYRGKTVEAVQLDGDDLFGYNYSIGTKNISINMVDQIEAIENYSKNPLLKGIENSDNVALNLKLKKGKIDYSGTGDIGYGYGDKSYYDIGLNLLGVAKKFKSFGTFSLNNIGVNSTPFDYFSGSTTLEDTNNENLISKKVINDSPIHSILSNSKSRVNEEWFGNYNFIYRFSPKLNVKSNIFYVKEILQNDFFVNTDLISYSDQTDISKRPENKRLDLKFTYNISKTSLIELETSISENRISSFNNFTRNFEATSISKLKTNDFFWNNKLHITSKLGSNKAFQFVSVFSRNNAPQEFTTFGNFFTSENINNSYFQFSEYRKENYENYLVFLEKKGNIKYALTAGVNYNRNPFQSFLLENEIDVVDFKNDFVYKKTNYFSNFSLVYKKKAWKIEPSLSVSYIDQSLKDNSDIGVNNKKESLRIEPSLKAIYNINSVSKLNFSGSYEQNTPEENYLFSNGVLTDNRTIRNNIVSLELQKLQSYNLAYRLNDLYNNIDARVIIGYERREKSYLSDLEVTPNFTAITHFQSPINLDNRFINGAIERYVRFVQTTLKLSSQYTISEFKNFVNQSDLRDGESKNYSGTVFAKTAFRFLVNFENSFTYTITNFSIDDQLSNSNNSIKNSFKTIVKPTKGWLFTFTYDYFKPNTKSNKDFSFLDVSLKYKPKNIKWISGRFIGKNLLDNRVFEQIENSDFSTTIYQSNLIPRYYLLSMDFNF